MRLIVTGGAGFIGSNFIRMLLEKTDEHLKILNLDNLTYAGNLDNLMDVSEDSRYSFIKGDIADIAQMRKVFEQFEPDAVINFAAESHVDRSIEDATPFIRANIQGTQILLDCAMKFDTKRFLQVSTDEVYGSLAETDPAFTEDNPIVPNSPYAASKASADHLVLAYHHTYDMDVVVTRCSNNYGPYQFPEKLIPLMIHNALTDKPLPVYGDGRNIRDWIYVGDHCVALYEVLTKGESGRVYNIGGDQERRNIEVVKAILSIVGKDESLIQFVKDRPGHDFRYAMDNTRITGELGWKPSVTFEEGLEQTISWYLSKKEWVKNVISGEYREYYEKMYGERLADK